MNLFKAFTLQARWLMTLLLLGSAAGCHNAGSSGSAVIITAPSITTVIPAEGAIGVALNSSVNATFSKALNPLTINIATFTLYQGATSVTGTVAYSGKVAVFYPASNFSANTVYTATVTTGVKDLLGNAFAGNYTWRFTTGTAPDLVPPDVGSVIPLSAATGVTLNTNIAATFSKPMDPLTINASTFTLMQGATPVSGTVSYAGTTASFHPLTNLAQNLPYTATITLGAKDMESNPLVSPKTWIFTTGTALAASPATVNLGTAGNYVILAKTGVSTTGTTVIVGDVGVSPAAASLLTGFGLIADSSNIFSTSSLVTGKLYGADYAVPTPINLTTAVGDMMTAYNDAAGRTLPDYTELGAGDISGMTLAPGLYKWGTGLIINSDVTLNGNATDVWIFQISGDLTLANSTSILLSGGALPKNIFWQVAGGVGVALGTTSHFEGVIIASKAITLTTGASGNSRLLAQTAVTMQSNAITQPAP